MVKWLKDWRLWLAISLLSGGLAGWFGWQSVLLMSTLCGAVAGNRYGYRTGGRFDVKSAGGVVFDAAKRAEQGRKST